VSLADGWVTTVGDHGGVLSGTKAVAMFLLLAVTNGFVVRDNTKVVAIDRAVLCLHAGSCR
jgi:hypothetical protein